MYKNLVKRLNGVFGKDKGSIGDVDAPTKWNDNFDFLKAMDNIDVVMPKKLLELNELLKFYGKDTEIGSYLHAELRSLEYDYLDEQKNIKKSMIEWFGDY